MYFVKFHTIMFAKFSRLLILKEEKTAKISSLLISQEWKTAKIS
jgi:hypothetical protein